MEENKQLRTLTQNLSKCIGEGIGGLTDRLGFTGETSKEDFDDFVNRGDKDTLHKLYAQFQEHRKNEMIKGAAGNPGYNGLTKLGGDDGKPDVSTNKGESPSTSRRNSPAPRSAPNSASKKEPTRSKKPTPEIGPVSAAQQVPQYAQVQQLPQPQQQYSQASLFPQQPPNGQSRLANSQRPSPDGYNGSTLNEQSIARAKSLAAFPFANIGTSGTPPVNFGNFLPQSNVPDFSQPYNQQMTGGPAMTPAENSIVTNGLSNFFFDTAEPSSMPTQAFTDNFITEYLKTGLTPSLGASSVYGDLQSFDWGMPFHQDTPSSSASSGNIQHQGALAFQKQISGKVENSEAVQAFYSDYAARAEAAGRYRLPNGMTPDEVISSNPILTLIHLISQ